MTYRVTFTRKARRALGELPAERLKSVFNWISRLEGEPLPVGTKEHEGLLWNNEAPELGGCTVYWQVIQDRAEVSVAWVLGS